MVSAAEIQSVRRLLEVLLAALPDHSDLPGHWPWCQAAALRV